MDYPNLWVSNFTYKVDVPPVNLALDLDFVKEWLKIDVSDTSYDAILTFLIESATLCAQEISDRIMITTGFLTFRNSFRRSIELRRSPFQSVTSFKYTVSGSLVDVDSSVYYNTIEKDYSKIILKSDSSYPNDGDDILQGIQIKFVAGYGDDSSDVPADLRLAMLNHLTWLFENRGDCDLTDVEKSLPNTSRSIYNKYKILEIANG